MLALHNLGYGSLYGLKDGGKSMGLNLDLAKTLVRNLSRLHPLPEAGIAAVSSLPIDVVDVDRYRSLARCDALIAGCALMIKGYACGHKTARSGRRQITSIYLPGDLIGLRHLMLGASDESMETISPSVIGWIRFDALKTVIFDHPAVALALLIKTSLEASIAQEWIFNVGARDARTRLAHLLCEFVVRRQIAGEAEEDAFFVPFTQAHLGEAAGLTAVHVNRMIRTLVEAGAMERQNGCYKVSDWALLQRLGDFDGAYLYPD